MTTASDDDVVQHAARHANLDATEIRLLSRHASAVYLLPAEGVVARIAHGKRAGDAAARGVGAARWFAEHGVPVTTPAPVNQPQRFDDHTITFWTYYPPGDRTASSTTAALGRLLRVLHNAPAPRIDLPAYRPLDGWADIVTSSPTLTADDREWLLDRQTRLLADYDQLDFPLGRGHIHGDAYPGNVLWDGNAPLLGDWDEVATGPRELDLANTYQGLRFGRPQAELTAFAQAYGYDVSVSAGLATLRSLRDLHTMGAYLRRADRGDLPAAEELAHRIATLRAGDCTTRWTTQ